jgi:hypothetical protein
MSEKLQQYVVKKEFFLFASHAVTFVHVYMLEVSRLGA